MERWQGQPLAPLGGRSERLRAQAESTAVAQIMSRQVVCLAPEARLDAVAEMFLARGISSAPVVNERWQPLGMISKTDLLRAVAGGDADSGGSIREITTPMVFSLPEEAPISVAAAVMAYEGVHRLPILAPSGEVVGMVSSLDIVRWAAETGELGSESEVPAGAGAGKPAQLAP